MIVTNKNILIALQDKNVICWSDLLGKLGLLPLFQQYKEQHGRPYDVKQMRMGTTLIGIIDCILREKLKKSKDKRVRGTREWFRLSIYGMDYLNFCPSTAEEDIAYLELLDL